MGVDAEYGQLVMALTVHAVPAFADNYLWLLHDDQSGRTAVVDPGDGEAVLAAAAERGWTIDTILNTHWHPDHTGGNLAVKEATGATIYGPGAEKARIPGLEVELAEGDQLRFGDHVARIWEVPGHTLGHIAYVFDEAGIAFVGDTLFAMGCGRLFEGTAEQMHRSLQRIASLPDETQLYPAHEYTLANAIFSAHVAPEDVAVASRKAEIERLRADNIMTLPTSVGIENATNLFVRAPDVATFAKLRHDKDSFR